jgi:hypothetical protein
MCHAKQEYPLVRRESSARGVIQSEMIRYGGSRPFFFGLRLDQLRAARGRKVNLQEEV